MAEDTDIVQAAIVLVGKFNPAIFSPAWFAKHDIITEGELKVAETEVVHKQVTRFTVEHLVVSIEPERFSIKVTTDPIIRIADMTLCVFRDLLSHTPIDAIGINYAEHWRLDTWQRRVALGRALAPVEPWGRWGEGLDAETPEEVGGLHELVMMEYYRDAVKGRRRIQVGPSQEVADDVRGVYVAVNHHRQFDLPEGEGAETAMDIIEREFDPAVRAAKDIIADLRVFAQSLELAK